MRELVVINSRLIVLMAIIGMLFGFSAVAINPKTAESLDSICPVDACVLITADGIQPAELAIKAGQTVQFISRDGKQHNLALGAGHDDHGEHSGHIMNHDHIGGVLSGDFGPDEAWQATFKETGSFEIHDHYNPDLSILVVSY